MSAIVAASSRDHFGRAAPSIGPLLGAMDHRGAASFTLSRRGVRLGLRSNMGGQRTSIADVHVVVDGRIHNRRELGAAQADSDAELIARQYQAHGRAGLEKLIGDFAFILFDQKSGRLLAARDALGMRPLYFTEHEGTLYLASEPYALLATGRRSKPHPLAVALFVASSYEEHEQTLREGIESLPPGHLLEQNETGISIRQYWQPNPWKKLDVDEQTAAEMFAQTFEQAVSDRLQNAGRVGVMLSGGLDSAAIACQAASLGSQPLALHCSLAGWECDETPMSEAVAQKWALPHVRIECSGEAMREATRPHRRHPDQLYQGWMAFFDALCKRAKDEGIETVMTGLGGDQLLDESGAECVDAIREGSLREALAISGVGAQPWSKTNAMKLLQGLKGAVPDRLRIATRPYRPRWSPPFLTTSWAQAVNERIDARQKDLLAQGWPDASSAAMCSLLSDVGIRIGTTQCNLLGAMHGLRVTHPFVDQRVFELALSLPRAHRLRRGWRKRKPILRKAVKNMLPERVAARRDAAEFSCYLRDIYVGVHREKVTALLKDSRLADLGIIDMNHVRSSFDSGLPSPHSIIQFGMVLSMELWLRQDWS